MCWNGKRPDLAYHALGRTTAIWLADRSKSAGQTPSVRYTYTVDGNNPTSIKTEKIENDGGYAEAVAESRQSPDLMVAATGQVAQINDTYYAAGAPSGQLLPSTSGDVDLQTKYVYDGLDRVTATITLVAALSVKLS